MSMGARVDSVDALKAFKIALLKFAAAANISMADAEAEIQRMLNWLETEAPTYWSGQLRKRQEIVSRCKEAVRQKKLFKDSSGRTPSAVDEEKALAIAMKRMQEADEKSAAVKRWARRLQKEIDLYKGSVQRFATTVQSEIPVAASKLDQMVERLEEYITLAPPPEVAIPTGMAGEGFARDAAPPPQEAPRGISVNDLSVLRDVRKNTPSPEVRAAAPPGEVGPARWKPVMVEAAQLQVLAGLNIPPQPVEPAHRITIAAETWAAPQIYLERLAPAFEGDCGWHIGPADLTNVTAHHSVEIGAFIEVRPDLRELLALPAGYVLMLNAGGIAALLDPQDRDIWPAKP